MFFRSRFSGLPHRGHGGIWSTSTISTKPAAKRGDPDYVPDMNDPDDRAMLQQMQH